MWLTLACCFGCATGVIGSAAGAAPGGNETNFIALARADVDAARVRCQLEVTNSVAAWELGRACFTWGKLLKDPNEQEKIYLEGAAACRRSIELFSNAAPAHYYLGMNIGRIANLKRNLSAFSLVKEVEREFHQARALDEDFSHAGPDRNLGLLYWHAPGWPVSVGDKKLARKHLQRAVELAANYPENRLNLAEAAVDWGDQKLLASELEAIKLIWPVAKTNLVDPEWELEWKDWEQRRARLQETATPK